MGRDIGFDLTLGVERNEENIRKILHQGAEIGCRYWDAQDASNNFQPIFTTPDQAIACVMSEVVRDEKGTGLGIVIPSVKFKYQDTACSLIFVQDRNGGMGILCSIFRGVCWYKEEPNEFCVDFERYLRLMLKICNGIPIVEMDTDDSYFETAFARLSVLEKNGPLRIDLGIEVTLAVRLDEESLQKVFERGAAIGFKYTGSEELTADGVVFMSTAKAVAYVMNKVYRHRTMPTVVSNISTIRFSYRDRWYSFIFAERVDLSMEIFWALSRDTCFSTESEYGNVVDWERYVTLMLDLCHGLPIMDFKTNDNSFNL